MYELLSTTAMSSIRPPILAGPIPRQTKRRSNGSVDQLIGVGVGLAVGVGVGVAVGAGVCDTAGASISLESSACAANAPSVTNTRAKAAIAKTNDTTLPPERHVLFIRREFLSPKL